MDDSVSVPAGLLSDLLDGYGRVALTLDRLPLPQPAEKVAGDRAFVQLRTLVPGPMMGVGQ